MKIFVAIMLCSLSLSLPAALAWGVIGHATIAAIAQDRLSSAAQDLVNTLLNGQSMPSVASWADDVRKEAQWAWTAPLHYIDTPDNMCAYEYTRDCQANGVKGFCVAGAIANFSKQIIQAYRTNRTTPIHFGSRYGGDVDPASALKFIIHFVGDIHQPLHVGFTSDLGGNTIHVTFYGTQVNLHALWDNNIIQRIIDKSYNGDETAWLKDLQDRVAPDGIWSKNATGWGRCSDSTTQNCITPVATESITNACKYSYECKAQGSAPCASEGVKKDSTLADAYYDAAYPIVNERIAQAGVRLAAYLNALVG